MKNVASEPITNLQKIILTTATLILIVILLFLRGGLSSQTPLNQLAEISIEPTDAINNGKPTVYEFYADWCEVCKKMAPSMLKIEDKYSNDVNFVMLNVDNPRWEELITKYQVNGIPQLNFLNKNSKLLFISKGFQSESELDKSFDLLVNEKNTDQFSKIDNGIQMQSNINLIKKTQPDSISPRSHG